MCLADRLHINPKGVLASHWSHAINMELPNGVHRPVEVVKVET